MSHSFLTRSSWGAWSKPLSCTAWRTAHQAPALPAPSPRLVGHMLAAVSLLRQESNKALVSWGFTSHSGLTSPPAPLLPHLLNSTPHNPPLTHPPHWCYSNTVNHLHHHPLPLPGPAGLCSLTLGHIPPKYLSDSLSHLTHHPAQTSCLKGAAGSLSDVHFSLSIHVLTFSFPALSIHGNTTHLPVKNIYMLLYLSSQPGCIFHKE